MIDIAGPLGGILAAAWGGGAVMGYGFSAKVISKREAELKEQIAELKFEMRDDKADCDRKIDDLTRRLREIEDRYMNHIERQPKDKSA